jgi:hypothetical protein
MSLAPFTESWATGTWRPRRTDRWRRGEDDLWRAPDCLAVHVALGYLTLGRLEAAAEISERIVDPIVRNDMLAGRVRQGRCPAFRQYLRTGRPTEKGPRVRTRPSFSVARASVLCRIRVLLEHRRRR